MFLGVLGHDDVAQRFRQSLSAGRMASTYLFVGPPGVGKRTFAVRLAQALLCQQHSERELAACGQCESCRLIEAGNHPDLLQVSRPEGKSAIPVELLIGPAERRMREGLCHDIGMKPFFGGRKVALIDDADFLNVEGANALLKTLEEPPPRSVLILIGSSAARQLPTICSRCQIIPFQPLDEATIADLLQQNGVDSPADAASLARLSGGSLARALDLAEPAIRQFRGELFRALAGGPPDSIRLAAEIAALVDAAGREAPPRRARLRQVIGFAAEYYRAMLRATAGLSVDGDPDLAAAVEASRQSSLDPERCVELLERCLEALEHIDRNANQATLLECWLNDLERITPLVGR